MGDYCFISASLLPGTLDQSSVCQPDASFPVGDSCGNDLFYSGEICVANNDSCTTGGSESGVYQNGICEALPVALPPTPPNTPNGFSIDTNGGALPGDTQPMCVNASPFIGGGAFVVSGTVLCYTGAGKNTGIYAYTDSATGGTAWNPFDMSTWDSMTMKDLYASDDISAQGTLSVFGGSQIYSLDGNSGLQVNNSGVLLGSGDANGNFTALSIVGDLAELVSADSSGNLSGLTARPTEVGLASTDGSSTSSATVSADNILMQATDGTSTSGLLIDVEEGITMFGDRASGGPAVSILGMIGDANDSGIGVIVSGDGQGDATYSGIGTAPWSDVLIASKLYASDGSLGSGVIVNDHGVTVRSSTVGDSYNEFGSGASSTATSSITNVIGDGGLGAVENYIGRAGAADTTVVNEIGTAGGMGASINRIGNANTATFVGATAGDSSMVVIHGALDFVAQNGASILPTPTQLVSGGTLTSMIGTSQRYAVTDSNGRVTVVEGTPPEANSAMYIVNGNGNTNAVTVTERTAVLTGGETQPTTMVLSDTGAHFSNSTNGDPVVVSGVADGGGPFDAANIRQLDSGLATVAALAGLPAPQSGSNNSLGIAFGHHNSGSAFAVGGQSQIGDDLSVKYGAAVAYSSGLFTSSASLGMGVSW